MTQAPHSWPPGNPVLLFDGVCNLCNSFVRFLLKQDRKEILFYAWLQSDAGRRLAESHGIDPSRENSVVLLSNNMTWTKSDAVLEVCRLLGGGWKFFLVFRILPKSLRDALYNTVARYRYRWFGKKNECQPVPEAYRSRFLR